MATHFETMQPFSDQHVGWASGLSYLQSNLALNASLIAQINHISASGKLSLLMSSVLFRVTIKYSNLWLLDPWKLMSHSLLYISSDLALSSLSLRLWQSDRSVPTPCSQNTSEVTSAMEILLYSLFSVTIALDCPYTITWNRPLHSAPSFSHLLDCEIAEDSGPVSCVFIVITFSILTAHHLFSNFCLVKAH